MIRLFREPQPGEFVVIGADPADGGSNNCVAQALSKKRADNFMNFAAKMESSQFGHELYKMAKYIYAKTGEWPLIGVERNTGMATINVLQTYNYPKLFRMKAIGQMNNNEQSDRIGWHTNTATRPKMLDDLALAIAQQALGIYDLETVKELMSFVKSERTGKPEAAVGALDDRVMALAIAWQMYQESPGTSKEGMSARIAQFPRQDLFDENGLPNY